MAATWIKKNMIYQPPGSDYHNFQSERKLTENELRVLRSIQKLSIPEWYLNSRSRPPKILSNDTPIEQRPPSWKNMPVNKRLVSEKTKNTVSHNGVLETPIETSPVRNPYWNCGAYEINRRSELSQKKTPEKKIAEKRSPSKCNIIENTATKSKNILNTSQTYPRISSSRKVQNINIVLQRPTKKLMVTDLDEDYTTIVEVPVDSSEPTTPEKVKSEKDEILIADAKEPTKPNNDEQRPLEKEKEADISDSDKENRDPAAISPVPARDAQSRRPFCEKSPNERAQDKPARKNAITKKNSSGEQCACKNFSRTRQTSQLMGPRTGFRPKNMLPPIPEKSCEPTLPTPSCPFPAANDSGFSSSSSPLTSLRKSSELERIVKREQQKNPRRSFVNEIIAELTQRCETTEESTKYVSPVSKNFVKQLVSALENGSMPPKMANEVALEREESEEEFVDSSDGEIKSAAMSTSISYPESETGSDGGLAPILPVYPAYDWNMNLRNTLGNYGLMNNNYETRNRNLPMRISPSGELETDTDDDDDGEWIYWNQRIVTPMPRTSSLLSVFSRISNDRVSPCVSPINENHWPRGNLSRTTGFFNDWGTIYKTRM